MAKNLNKKYLIEKQAEKNIRLEKYVWFSSQNYYFLMLGITIAAFFIIWGVLHSGEEETPWITAGIVAGLILISGVILREFVFRKKYQEIILGQKRLDNNIKNVYKHYKQQDRSNRLTIERNEVIVRDIENKSNIAKITGKSSELHLEVFEMCNGYLQKSNRELASTFKGSPRYAAIRNGQEKLKVLHHYHLLTWASIESQLYIQTSKVQASMNDKLENAQRALGVLDSAMLFYPEEESLLESAEAVKNFIVSIKVSHWIEQAERAAFKENYQRAINHYRDALFFLARENERTAERDVMAENINFEIEKLREKITGK